MIAIKKEPFQLNRGLPYHTEAEQAVLGAILIHPAIAIPHTLGYLNAEDFYIPAHREIFSAMLTLHRAGQPIDIVLLVPYLRDNIALDAVGGCSYLAVLTEQTPTAENVKYYARLLKGETNRRKRILRATEEIEKAYTLRQEPAKGFYPLADVLEAVLEDNYATTTEGRYSGYTTGFETLDGFLGGLHKGEVYIIAGRPSHGKSALCTQVGNHIFLLGGRVAFFPLEAGLRGQARNIAAMHTQVEGWKLRAGKGSYQTPDEMAALIAYRDLQRTGIFNLSLAKTPHKMETVLREMVAQHGGFDVIILDHLQEMLPSDNNKWTPRHLQIEGILQEIRRMAREFEVPVILAAQIGRNAEGREPTLAEIKDSGSIEQIADVVLIIHGESRGTGARTLTVAKNRGGATGKLNLWLQGEILRFREADL